MNRNEQDILQNLAKNAEFTPVEVDGFKKNAELFVRRYGWETSC